MASRERLTLPGAGGFVFPRPVSSARAPRDGSEGTRGMFARDVEHATLAQDGRDPLPARGDLEQLDDDRVAGLGVAGSDRTRDGCQRVPVAGRGEGRGHLPPPPPQPRIRRATISSKARSASARTSSRVSVWMGCGTTTVR